MPLDDPDAYSFSGDRKASPERTSSRHSKKTGSGDRASPPTTGGPAASPLLPPLQQLRELLSEHPELLEAGLESYRDEKGDPSPAPVHSPVGDIDLIASDTQGGLVVVTIVPPGEACDNLVSEVLQRIGWVRRHLARGRGAVRGIVVLETPLERLGYSAAALAGVVSFKLCRMAVSFDSIAPDP